MLNVKWQKTTSVNKFEDFNVVILFGKVFFTSEFLIFQFTYFLISEEDQIYVKTLK